MASISLLDLPEELLSQVFGFLNLYDLCQSAQTSGTLNELCERLIYKNVSVIKYAYSHVGKTDYDGINCFFNAVKKRPQRLSYVKEVNARLELRMDFGLYHACELFEALPKMPHLTDLCLEVVGGINYRENRALEQSMVWGCTFERGRMAMYKFFRLCASDKSDELSGLHSLNSLRSLKVKFPLRSIGLQTDLAAYSALQHKHITRLELRHIVNAALAPPKLLRPAGAITHLTMQACHLPLRAYQRIFESLSALEYLDYRPARPVGGLDPGGLVNALAHHSESLRSLSIKVGADEMMGMDFSAFTSLTHLQVHNPVWDEDVLDPFQNGAVGSIDMPAIFPPHMDTLTLKNFHVGSFAELNLWMETTLSTLKKTALLHLKELRLEAEYLANEYTFDIHPMYLTSASEFHVNSKVLNSGTRLYREVGVELSVKDTLYFGQEAYAPGPYELGSECMSMLLSWKCWPQNKDSKDLVSRMKTEMYPEGAVERLLLLRGNNLGGQLSWPGL